MDLASLGKTPEFQLKDKDLTDTGIFPIEELSEGQNLAVSRYVCVYKYECMYSPELEKELSLRAVDCSLHANNENFIIIALKEIW